MLIACWSAKGGVGTTVVAASLALMIARREPGGAVLADLAGDVPSVLGLAVGDEAPVGARAGVSGGEAPEGPTAGLAGWLAAGESVPADALARLEVPATEGLSVLPRGAGPLAPRRAAVLAALLGEGGRPVVVDCGTVASPGSAAEVVAMAAAPSLMVTRPCYVALRRARQLGARPTGVIVVREPGRVLGRGDVERVVEAPVVAEIETDPAVARAVDAGLLAVPRLPRSISRGLRRAA